MKATAPLLCCALASACAVDPDPSAPAGETAVDATCDADADCDDGDPCDGVETCGPDGDCQPGEPVACGPNAVCEAHGPDPVCVCAPGFTALDDGCAVACPVPTAPVLGQLHLDDALHFMADGPIATAVLAADADPTDARWEAVDTRSPEALGPWRVLARTTGDDCAPGPVFDHTYAVVDAFSGPIGTPGAEGVPRDDPRLTRWATDVEVTYGEAVDPTFQTPALALGPATGSTTDTCSLGRGGQATFTFDGPLADGPGPDLAVFENAFSDTFLELAYVEVSSDGVSFARFDAAAHTPDPVDAFGAVDATTVAGLAGKDRAGVGTPFDLAWLRHRPEVLDGRVDLRAVTHVRLVDVVGDGSDRDRWDRPVHDPFPTTGSAGFDVEAVGVLEAP